MRAVSNLRDATNGYFHKWVDADCAEDKLPSEDWIVLEKIKSFLEKLKMKTKALESSFATLENVHGQPVRATLFVISGPCALFAAC